MHCGILLWEIIWEESISLIPQSLKNWGTPISWKQCLAQRGERQGGSEGKWMKQKQEEKQRERKKNTSDGGFWNCLVPTLLIIFHISLCGGGFFGDGCLSAAVTGITMMAGWCFCFIYRETDAQRPVPALPVTNTRSLQPDTGCCGPPLSWCCWEAQVSCWAAR